MQRHQQGETKRNFAKSHHLGWHFEDGDGNIYVVLGQKLCDQPNSPKEFCH